MNLSGRLEADDGRALVELLGLDRFMVVDKRPGRLTLTAKGPLDGQLAVDGQLAAGAFDIATKGTVRSSGRGGSKRRGSLSKSLTPMYARRGRWAGARGAAAGFGVCAARFDRWQLRSTEVAGTVAGTSVAGRLAIGMRTPIRSTARSRSAPWICRSLSPWRSGYLATPARTRPRARTANQTLWPAEPFEEGSRAAERTESRSSQRLSRSRRSSPRAMSGACCISAIRSLHCR